MADREALVVGAGIAGLSAGIALRRGGWRVTVVEASAGHNPVGAGIVLGPNAVAALDLLGVPIREAGRPLAALTVRDATGRRLAELAWGTWGPAVALSRSALHRALDAALPGDVPLLFATTLTSTSESDSHVDVECDDGGRRRVDLLVGADGIRSTVRRVIGNDIATRYSGYTCWRAIVPGTGVTEASEFWDGGRRVGLVPLPGDDVYVYLVHDAPAGDPGPATPAGIAARFDGFPTPVGTVLAALAAAPDDAVLHHDLHDLPGTCWGTGRTWLTGDAAHAMLPNLGQGAAMAIEDAVALRLAASTMDLARGLERYRTLRERRVTRVQRDSYLLGRVAQVRNPVAAAGLALAGRLTPQRVAARQVADLVAPGVELVAAARPGW